MKRTKLPQQGENRAGESGSKSIESKGDSAHGSKEKSGAPLTTKTVLGFKRYNQVIGTGAAK